VFTSTTGLAPRLSAGAAAPDHHGAGRRRRRRAGLGHRCPGPPPAAIIAVPDAARGYGPGAAPPAAPVPATVTGGTPGWQITLIAVAAAVIAATAAAFLDRAGNSRRPPPPQDETRRTRPGLDHDHSPGPAGKTRQAQAKIIRLPS
jgi:hypothetical protein